MTKRISEDVCLQNGSIILYSQPRIQHFSSKCVQVKCGDCGSIRLVQHPALKYKKFTGLCLSCSNRKIADSNTGAQHPNWRGGYTLSKEGYVYIHHSVLDPADQKLVSSMLTNHNYVLQHRLVMAKRINRPLKSNEHVHHMNGIKDDNRPENLMLCSPTSHRQEEKRIIDALKARIRELEM